SRAESNHANANRPGFLRCFNCEAYARSKSIVSSWRVPASRVQYLLAVNNLAVNQCAHGCVGVREIILHAKRSIEVAHGKPVLRAIYRLPIYQITGQRDKQAAQRSSGRNHQIEQRQMPGMWLQPRQFAVTNHAAYKQAA